MKAEANKATAEASSNGATARRSLLTLNLQSAGISTIIWASGHQLDFGWIQIPVFDQTGYPVHQRGVTAFPGLYFLGLSWLYKRKSSLLYGVGEDAAFIASAIADRAGMAVVLHGMSLRMPGWSGNENVGKAHIYTYVCFPNHHISGTKRLCRLYALSRF